MSARYEPYGEQIRAAALDTTPLLRSANRFLHRQRKTSGARRSRALSCYSARTSGRRADVAGRLGALLCVC